MRSLHYTPKFFKSYVLLDIAVISLLLRTIKVPLNCFHFSRSFSISYPLTSTKIVEDKENYDISTSNLTGWRSSSELLVRKIVVSDEGIEPSRNKPPSGLQPRALPLRRIAHT